MAEHRVPVLSGALHRYLDPARSSDPRVRAVVTALGTAEPTPPPSAHFRAELRAQLVAVAPRLVAEGEPERIPAPAERDGLRAAAGWLPRLHLGRKIRFAAAALTVLAMALTGAVWLSRGALPGDALYGLKRAGETAQFSLTSGNVARARDLLSFAKTRADEVSGLLGNASASGAGPQASGISSHTAGLVRSTLDSADDDVRQAAQLLGSQAVADRSAGPLDVMTGWAPAQQGRLDAIVARIPAGSLHARAQQSAALVAAAYERAQQLRRDLGCGCLSTGQSDQLGPLPCHSCTAAPGAPGTPSGPGTGSSGPGTPAQPSTTRPGTHSSGAQSPGTGGSSTTLPLPGTSGSGSGQGGGSSSRPAQSTTSAPLPGLPLPSLPLPTTSSVPVTPPSVGTSSCGTSVSLGPVLIGVGTCGVQLGF